jgi:HprK-related kinase A
MPLTVSGLGEAVVRQRLRSATGLRLRTGPFVAAVRSPLADVSQAFSRLYADYAVEPEGTFTDFHVAIKRPTGLRQLWKPQVSFEFDGGDPFNPLPGDQGFPLLEWGLNWCVYGMCHQYLILHAAVLERNGHALILPAPSGSGKSTLCAGLLFHGWRLLSDELALICPRTGRLIANPRPVSLKNESIDVITRLVPSVQFGSRVSETIKGVVAHFPAPTQAVLRAGETALPGWVVLPRYVAGSSTQLKPMERARALLHLVENAFNYDIFGEEGFDMLGALADRSACFSFEYSRLKEAIELFAELSDRPPRVVAAAGSQAP